MNRIILLMWISYLPVQAVFSQDYKTSDNYIGSWEMPTSWNPTWTAPKTSVYDKDITINGYIIANGSLSFSGTSKLIVDDTLVIHGDLVIVDDNDVQVNNKGILIVRGSLTISELAQITADGYIIITGDIIKLGQTKHGKFTSHDDPVKVFVGGTISPEKLTDNKTNYTALDCTSPETIPYPNSACSYGNLTDIVNDPIYPFFQSTCTTATPTITASGPLKLCAGGSVTLTSSEGLTYLWSTGATTASINITETGSYSVRVTNAIGCLSAESAAAVITANTLPLVNISSGSTSMCVNELMSLTGSPAGGIFKIVDGPGIIDGNELMATGTGNIYLEYNYNDVCANKAKHSILVNDTPVAIAGPDQELKIVHETQMRAELSSSETGEWSLISGSGHFSDIHSPTSRVSELSVGENSFQWKVRNGNCEATAEVKITVYDLFIPSVITPNGDGKNDYFKISAIGQVELIIFNRWGNEEYTNDNYLNDWDGHNNKGAELPNDTYFYILKYENGTVNKGSVLIKR